MSSLTILILFCVMSTVCCGDIQARKKHEYKLYWHGFHYLLFLAFKFKVFFVLGTIFTIGLVAGKLFGLYKFAEYMKKTHYDHYDDHHEKVVYVNPHGPTHDFPTAGGFSSPGGTYGKSFLNGNGESHESYPPGYSVDQLPQGTQISAVGSISSPGQVYNSRISQGHQPLSTYGRSINTRENSIYEKFDALWKMIRKLNITEMAFDNMNLKSDDCKRKFVCEADFNAKASIVLKAAYSLLSDESYSRYKTKKMITSLDECGKLYPNCLETT